jgi:hypothetical protein
MLPMSSKYARLMFCLKFRVKLVDRDYSPLGHNLVDPVKSGMTTQYDLGTVSAKKNCAFSKF